MFSHLFRSFFVSMVFLSWFVSLASAAGRLNFDSSAVKLRSFDPHAMKEYAADKDFHYDRAAISTTPSLWDRFWHWFWSQFPDVMANAEKGGNAKYLFIVLGCAAIIFAIVKFAGMDIRLIFTGKSAQLELPYTETIENIHEISFTAEIEKAVAAGNYRLAVRLLYLQCLKDLNDAGRIKWEPDKTNSRYINELKHSEQKNQFKDLTRRFEYVWYGNFPVDKASFQIILTSFKNFKIVKR